MAMIVVCDDLTKRNMNDDDASDEIVIVIAPVGSEATDLCFIPFSLVQISIATAVKHLMSNTHRA
jgi:hypothetical protein